MKVGRIKRNVKKKISELYLRFKNYVKRLLFPLYLFPVKTITYSTYYIIKFFIKTLISLIKIFFETITFPFRSLKNFLKSIFITALVIYIFASLFVIVDYIQTNYGHYSKFLCGYGVDQKLKDSVVRIVGGYSEGSGFFISENQVLTNFHVIAGEPSPKIIFSDGSFATPETITGTQYYDLAILFTKENYPDLVLEMMDPLVFYDREKLIAAGYALGTDLAGEATIQKGEYVSFREQKSAGTAYIQTDINLVVGMSGGPLVDICGKVVGVNTLGLAGLSLFIPANWVERLSADFTDSEITKIEVDPSVSPEEAVRAFYTYLKARRMEDGFALLSSKYLEKTNFEEWTNRFTDILDVEIYISEPHENTDDTAFVKFSTKNWNDEEVDYHYYEGTWQTVLEDGVYKMNRSKIREVTNPSWEWYYSSEP